MISPTMRNEDSHSNPEDEFGRQHVQYFVYKQGLDGLIYLLYIKSLDLVFGRLARGTSGCCIGVEMR